LFVCGDTIFMSTKKWSPSRRQRQSRTKVRVRRLWYDCKGSRFWRHGKLGPDYRRKLSSATFQATPEIASEPV